MDNLMSRIAIKVFLNDEWLLLLQIAQDDNRSGERLYICSRFRAQCLDDEYVWNSAAGEGRTAVWRVNPTVEISDS
ncbi:hypothetical protein OK016_26665 [Vibrio chagasii]|nr:hypothetical protein [Vibrio chagasii]